MNESIEKSKQSRENELALKKMKQYNYKQQLDKYSQENNSYMNSYVTPDIKINQSLVDRYAGQNKVQDEAYYNPMKDFERKKQLDYLDYHLNIVTPNNYVITKKSIK